jgi:hypothetical protein
MGDLTFSDFYLRYLITIRKQIKFRLKIICGLPCVKMRTGVLRFKFSVHSSGPAPGPTISQNLDQIKKHVPNHLKQAQIVEL